MKARTVAGLGRWSGTAAGAAHLAAAALVTVGLVTLARANFLLFHSAAEVFSAAVAFGVFFLAWNSRRFASGGFFLIIGVAYLYAGGLDLVHALAYKGMGILDHGDANRATQLWIAARALESLSLVAAFAAIERRPNAFGLQVVYSAITGLLLLAVFSGNFPDCFVEGLGLTPFKIWSEYAIIAVLAAAALLLRRQRRHFERGTRLLLFAMLALKIGAEIAFTTYGNVFGDAIMVGHLLKVAAFYLFYRATIAATLTQPYDSLFRDLQAARDTLELSEQRFRLALLPAPLVVFSNDRDLRFTWGYNWGGREVVGRTDADILPQADAAMVTVLKRQVLDSGRGLRREVVFSNGAVCDLTLEPLRDRRGDVAGVIGTAIEVTALVAARAEAERANEAKSRFLAAASHDLRQPFQAMRLFHHLLASGLERPEQRDLADKLEEAMAGGEHLLHALLDISILEAGAVQPQPSVFPLLDVLGPVHREFAPQAAEKGLELRLVPCALAIRSDRMLLTRMVRNLVANALRYTVAGSILIGCRRDGARVRIEVWDSGIGIPPESLGDIFEDFLQLANPERDRNHGLGLGLSIVARLGRLLDHPVRVRSQASRGSVFSVSVPCGTMSPAPVAVV